MIDFFAEYDQSSGRVLQCLIVERPYEGNFMESGRGYLGIDAPINWGEQDTPTKALFVVDGALEWIETAPLTSLRADAIASIDRAAETLRLAIISQPTQTEEYRRVEGQARAWAAAGYPEDEAPRGVSGWAQAKWRDGWTNRQACDDILATADAWLAILDTIRDLRLANKEDVRHATSSEAIGAIVADMKTDMRAIAAQMNIPLDLEQA